MIVSRFQISFRFSFLALISTWVLALSLLTIRAFGQPRTDPSEVRALNSIFGSWNISSTLSTTVSWNITGDPCSGAALNSSYSLDDAEFNPGIKCSCSLSNTNACHITELKVVDQSLQGEIPEDLKYLVKLTKLQLHGNSLPGVLPKFIGNLTSLENLNLSSNILSGAIPKEFGNLTNLIYLDLSINKFSNSLPVELAKLVNLEELKLNSAGISGAIPSTYNVLKKLRVLWISDNEITGSVPDLIGQFTKLEDLRMQGNSFQGPIPPSFANLTKLIHLVLRNCNISGTIPSFIGSYKSLDHLDLSFNSLSGELPPSLFSMPSLEYLFLGNNSLTGTLPLQKSSRLLTIDLSYNRLSGSFPSWVNEANLKLNLVMNDFFFDNINDTTLPGLRCLQRSMPCHLHSPIQSSFAINCGGTTVVDSNDGPLFEIDSAELSSASYYVTNDTRWAVSSAGRFLDVAIPIYIQSTLSRFVNTQDPDLFQSGRLSPSSIRYYGLGLQNGNYIVKMYFGESDNWNPNQGRRLFDIFIQGSLVFKDFDITARAGGRTLVAVEVNYTAPVTNNFLEIHLFWAGKGTCCIPTNGYYGPLISALSVTPGFSLLNVEKSTSGKRNRDAAVGVAVAIIVVCSILVIGTLMWRKKRKLKEDEDQELLGIAGKPTIFGYQELRTATNDFNQANKLGEGGFGTVYKGVLVDGTAVAVKKLSALSIHGKRQFVTEIATISAVQHRNLVQLHGCCYEGKNRLLVFEYLENRSLDQLLFENKKMILDWPVRFQICLGIARGLTYLHEECNPRIIHRDVKASNILLDHDLNPKIADFGVAKLHDDKKSQFSTGIAGTVGYLAPEYAIRGQLTEKVDVFSFGVVLFEILCGRQNTEQGVEAENIYLLEWVWHLRDEKRPFEMLDPVLTSYEEHEVHRVIGVAFLCTQAPPSRRPTMSKVVSMLVGDVEIPEVLARPSYLMEWMHSDVNRSASIATTSRSNLFNMSSGIPSLMMMSHTMEGR